MQSIASYQRQVAEIDASMRHWRPFTPRVDIINMQPTTKNVIVGGEAAKWRHPCCHSSSWLHGPKTPDRAARPPARPALSRPGARTHARTHARTLLSFARHPPAPPRGCPLGCDVRTAGRAPSRPLISVTRHRTECPRPEPRPPGGRQRTRPLIAPLFIDAPPLNIVSALRCGCGLCRGVYVCDCACFSM